MAKFKLPTPFIVAKPAQNAKERHVSEGTDETFALVDIEVEALLDSEDATETLATVEIELEEQPVDSNQEKQRVAAAWNPKIPESHAFDIANLGNANVIPLPTPEFPHLPDTPTFTLEERYKYFQVTVDGGSPQTK